MVLSLSIGLLIGAAVASYNKGYDATQFIPFLGLIGVVASFEHAPDIHYSIGFSILVLFICFSIILSIAAFQDQFLREHFKNNLIIHDDNYSDEEVDEQGEQEEQNETQNMISDNELDIETLEDADDQEDQSENETEHQVEDQQEQTDENQLVGLLATSNAIVDSDEEQNEEKNQSDESDDEMTGIVSSPEEVKKIEEIIQDKTYVEEMEKEKYPDVATILTHNREDLLKDVKLDDRKDYFDFSQNKIEQVIDTEKLLELIRVNPIISSQRVSSDSLLPHSPINEVVEDSSHKMEEID